MGMTVLEGSDGTYLTGYQLWQRTKRPGWRRILRDEETEVRLYLRADDDGETLVRFRPLADTDLPPGFEIQTRGTAHFVEHTESTRTDGADDEASGGAPRKPVERLRERAATDPAAVDVDELRELLRPSSDDLLPGLEALNDVVPSRAADLVETIPWLANHLTPRASDTVRERTFACLAGLVEYCPENATHVGGRLAREDFDTISDASESVAREAARCLRSVTAVAPDGPDYPRLLVALLTVEDSATRVCTAAALRTVAEYDPERVRPSVTPLLDVLVTGPDVFQRDALRTLGAVAVIDSDVARRVVPSALPYLGMEHADLRRTAVDVLARVAASHPERVSDYPGRLVPLLDDEDDAVRASASAALAALAPVVPVKVWPAMGRFVALLDDADPAIRRSACRALGHVGATEARTALREIRESDPSGEVREAADAALARL